MLLSSLGNKWMQYECEQSSLDSLANQLSIDPTVAEILARRGYSTPESARSVLKPTVELPHDPFCLSDMERAANEMAGAIKGKEPITIYGDYDADGLSSVACLVRGLRILGANVDWYIPNRLDEGYGISAQALKELSERGTKVVCSVDCGITAVEEAKLVGELGLRLIITDHHQPGPELPDALAAVDPWRNDDSYPFKFMAGVGVAYNLLLAVDSTLIKSGWKNRLDNEQRRFLLQFVALGTIADVVPLKDINRYFVQHGLDAMNNTPCDGIRAIGKRFGISRIETVDIGFKIAPCINAAGRLGSAEIALELLLCDGEGETAELAEKMFQINEKRKQLKEEGKNIALELLKADPDTPTRKSLVVASEQFHHGVIGIIANNLLDIYQKPVYVIAIGEDGIGKGSGRSLPAVDLLEATNKCGPLIIKNGGHTQAAGLTISTEKIEEFKAAFEEAVNSMGQAANGNPEVFIDAVITPDKLTLDLLNQLAVLKPFGSEWSEPVFLIKNLIVKNAAKRGSDSLSLVLLSENSTIQAFQFNMFSKFKHKAGDKIDLVFSAEENSFNGRKTLQAKIIDFREA
jgi:single-stranded-DNA-specific exonuclease